MGSQLPSVPDSISNASPEVAAYLEQLRQALDGSLQSIESQISGGGIHSQGLADLPAGMTSDDTPTYYGVPPKLSMVEAGGAIHHIMLRWNTPNNPNHSHVEVWRSAGNNLSTAERIGFSYSGNFSDEVSPGKTYYYWVRAVSKANVFGPWQSDEGVQGSTEQDSEHVLNVLTTKQDGFCKDSSGIILHDYDGREEACTADGHYWVDESFIRLPFKTVSVGYCTSRTGDTLAEYQTKEICKAGGGSWVEPGVYMDSAWIIKATIGTAHISQLYADDIDVNELSAFTANLGDVIAGTMRGPRGNFLIDLWRGQLNVYDDAGQLRVRLGELGEIDTSIGIDTIDALNDVGYVPPDIEGSSIASNEVYKWIEDNQITQIEFWTYLMASDNRELFQVWAGDAAGLCVLMTDADEDGILSWSCV